MKTRVSWLGDALFVGESGSGHCVVMDGPPDHGGRNVGVRPMEMLLMGLGGCTAFDIVDILRKGRQKIVNCVTEIDAERADEVPAVFTRIHVRFTITGHQLDPRRVARAVRLSAEKYCSASIMLARAGVKISHEFEIVEAAA